MNFLEPQQPNREAKIRYLDADFQILVQGDHVRCAVTHQPIRLDEVKYWSVARQEAYATPEAAMKRHLEVEG